VWQLSPLPCPDWVEGQTQQQIADDLGISEREVGRVLVTGSSPDTNNDCRVKADEEAAAELQPPAEPEPLARHAGDRRQLQPEATNPAAAGVLAVPVVFAGSSTPESERQPELPAAAGPGPAAPAASAAAMAEPQRSAAARLEQAWLRQQRQARRTRRRQLVAA